MTISNYSISPLAIFAKCSAIDPWNICGGLQGRIGPKGSLFGIRTGGSYGSGAGGKYAANRTSGEIPRPTIGKDTTFTRRAAVVTLAGVVRTSTTGTTPWGTLTGCEYTVAVLKG